MNSFYLIRHGEKVKKIGDPELTEKGKEQARKTAQFLIDKKIQKIFCSTYRRTRETAEIIDKLLNVGICFDARLRERMNWGDVPDQNFEDFLKEWKYSVKNRNYQPEVGVSSFKAGFLAQKTINEIADKFKDQNIVLITHGGVISDLLRNIFPNEDFSDEKIKECSITTLIKEDNNFVLKKFGDIKHLINFYSEVVLEEF